jgi:hypothetical protein
MICKLCEESMYCEVHDPEMFESEDNVSDEKGDEKLTPERAVRLLRAKGAELENLMPTIDAGEIRWLAADIALIAQLLADHIESTGIKFYLPDEPLFVPGANDIDIPPTHKMPSRGFETGGQPWGPDHPDYDEMGQ